MNKEINYIENIKNNKDEIEKIIKRILSSDTILSGEYFVIHSDFIYDLQNIICKIREEYMIYVDSDHYNYLSEQDKKVWKAIEYIEEVKSINKQLEETDMYWEYKTFFPELLNILKGSDKDDK